ncbi:SDR family NAD(P)-dependent oxidoreductase [Ruegeria sp. HKCCD8929]|uniref:SDR family NAD(P)-dependent oxidoreductase n=1 Tax=Ruegeria sp. HKCCD8929 TaxID=2683006 RepID=UPI001488D259|nr:SDR family NAD(P)-dependent oxidoreductase [Ruegeria sp. HKCCD8929]
MKLEGKKALIVGASSGLGLETAKLFASEGAEVAIVARNEASLQKAAAEIGGDVTIIPTDVADDAACETIVPNAVAKLGGLDVMVYCAGVIDLCPLEDMTVESFRKHIDVNLTGNFIVARDAALHMKRSGGGNIVNVSSELSHIGMGLCVHYCASKAGVVGLTQALAAEMAPTVRVNSVSPGPIDTPMLRAEIEWLGGTDEVLQGAIDRVPLKRFSRPAEVAKAVLFLAADADYATGSTLRLDGGTTAV